MKKHIDWNRVGRESFYTLIILAIITTLWRITGFDRWDTFFIVWGLSFSGTIAITGILAFCCKSLRDYYYHNGEGEGIDVKTK